MSTGGGSAPSRGPLGACVQRSGSGGQRSLFGQLAAAAAGPAAPAAAPPAAPVATRSPRGRGGQAQEQMARRGTARKRRGASKEGRWCMGGGIMPGAAASKHALPACRYCLGPQCPTSDPVAHRPTRLWHAWPGGPVEAAGGPAGSSSSSSRGARQSARARSGRAARAEPRFRGVCVFVCARACAYNLERRPTGEGEAQHEAQQARRSRAEPMARACVCFARAREFLF
jgi:hypothetical protein